MNHGYDGARTMSSQFLENFWGWQVTNPEMITDAMWREVKSVYVDDRYDLGLDEFLRDGPNQHVRANMLAIMLVAMQKGSWDADPESAEQIAREFATLIAENGLPGSGHTRPDHPMLDWIEPKLPPELAQRLREIRLAARVEKPESQTDPHIVREVQAPQEPQPPMPLPEAGQVQQFREETPLSWPAIAISLCAVVLFAGGLLAGSRGGMRR